MVSLGSFEPIPIKKKEQTFYLTYDASKSLVEEFGTQLPERNIPVELEVDGEITINYVYLGMNGSRAPNCSNFYDIIIDDLDVWDFNSESKDKTNSGLSTFIKKG